MRLEGVELVRVDVPFREDIGTGAGVHRLRPLLFVRVVAAEGEGWGECGALAEGTAVDPPLRVVEAAAADRGVSRLSAPARPGEAASHRCGAPQLFGGSAVDRMVAATFEMAVSDAELRMAGQSMAAALGTAGGFETMPVGPSSASGPDATWTHCAASRPPRCARESPDSG